VHFRSTLEASYAQALDRTAQEWEYEPCTFRAGGRVWVPDFYLPGSGAYVELKNQDLSADETAAQLRRIAVAFAAEPGATVRLVIWRAGEGAILVYERRGKDSPWTVRQGALEGVINAGLGSSRWHSQSHRAMRLRLHSSCRPSLQKYEISMLAA
jgi:hypothetical protein